MAGVNPIDSNAFSVSSISMPLLSRQRFADLIGLPVGVIEKQCERGYWPTVRVGHYSLINVASIQRACLERDQFTL